jgi:hypothetical protein
MPEKSAGRFRFWPVATNRFLSVAGGRRYFGRLERRSDSHEKTAKAIERGNGSKENYGAARK